MAAAAEQRAAERSGGALSSRLQLQAAAEADARRTWVLGVWLLQAGPQQRQLVPAGHQRRVHRVLHKLQKGEQLGQLVPVPVPPVPSRQGVQDGQGQQGRTPLQVAHGGGQRALQVAGEALQVQQRRPLWVVVGGRLGGQQLQPLLEGAVGGGERGGVGLDDERGQQGKELELALRAGARAGRVGGGVGKQRRLTRAGTQSGRALEADRALVCVRARSHTLP